jgi:predicted RNA-binding Zn ribbon-like protein
MTQERLAREIRPRDSEFRFRSGRLCLDFVATVGDRAHLAFDRWRSEDDFGRWCEDAGLLAERITIRSNQLMLARHLRETIYRLVRTSLDETKPQKADLEFLNELASRPTLIPQLKAIGAAVAQTSPAPFQAVLSAIARDAIDLLSGPQRHRVRECADENCSILFVDTSRPGKRRWCAMSGCGNKVKKASFRERQRSVL